MPACARGASPQCALAAAGAFLASSPTLRPPPLPGARDEYDVDMPPGDYDIIITDRRTGVQQVERVHVGENESVAVDISPQK